MSSYIPTLIENVNNFNDVTLQPSIDWNFNRMITENNSAITQKPLYTISGFWQEKFRSTTSELWCTRCNIPQVNVSTLKLELNMRRASRIQDLVIQLTYNGDLIGNNVANLENPVHTNMYSGELTTPINPAADHSVYGGDLDAWGLTSWPDVTDESFGVVISFQSNIEYPHRDLAYVDQITLSINT